jgi:hypothetical protein
MSLKSIINGSKEVYALVDHETNEEKKCSNEENENSPQLSNLLRIKRGRKTDKTDYKIHDRDSPDNIRRKVKTHFHNFMVALLNMKVRQILKMEEKLGKISFKMTQDLSVEFNQKLFKTKIKDIIIVMSNKYSNKNRNRIILNEIKKKVGINDEIILLLNLNYEDLYRDYYLKSNKETFKGEEDESYEAHQEKLKKKFGNKYANKYKNIAESLIDFFDKCKKRQPKQKLRAPSFGNIYDSAHSIINYNEKKYEMRKVHQKNLVDRGTQTEIYISDDE